MKLKTAIKKFLVSKEAATRNEELSPRTLADYRQTCDRMQITLGDPRMESLRPTDFEQLRAAMAQGRSPNTLKADVTRAKVFFKWAYDSELTNQPARFGQSFKSPSRKVMRKHRNGIGPKLFTAEEVRDMIEAANVPLRAMILLGINGGLGNTDVASVPMTAIEPCVDMDVAAWLNFPRPKTGVARRIPLWYETLDAITAAIDQRPLPADPADEGLLFLSRRGTSWRPVSNYNPVAMAFGRLKLGAARQKPAHGFYTLRRCFQTIGDGANDALATRAIMGHAEDASDMSAVYRQEISDDRLRVVGDYIHNWLFDKEDE